MTTNQELSPGKELGQYELLLPIAQGGMATVWAARKKGSRGFQKTVAVKTMLPALSDDAQFETMFLEEARLASGIHHPNVAEILDLGEVDDILYIVMEWVDGEALSVISRAAKKNDILLPLRIALRIVGQACLGLHAAHELRDPDNEDQLLGLVHRDVSPQNILVTYDGHVKLVDFGVAKATNRASGETTAGQLKGKIPYMSPEQARGGQVDRRTDIFAMGIVLYRLTTGTHPFVGENDLLTMRNIISRPVLPPRAKNPRFSPDLEQVLLKCLQKDPDRRYQTMLELERAVDGVIAKGAAVTDDDVGMFVRTLMGDRSQKRRAALRDAVRMLDERVSHPPNSTGPLVHDGVSELVLTQMNSGVQGGLAIPPPRHSSPSMTPGEMLPDTAVQTSTTSPVALAAGRRRSGVVFAAAAVTVAVLVGGGLLLFVGSGPDQTTTTDPPPSLAAGSAAPEAPTAEPTATAEPTTVVAATSAETTPAVDVNDLPGAKQDGGNKGPRPTGKVTTGGAPTAAPSVTVKPSSTKWVPSVTNPGF